MAHTDYYYEFGDHMPDGSPDTRWQTAPARGLNRTHDALVNGAIGVMDGARAVKDFAGNTTFNPLPYGEYAQSAYDGMQNLYGNALDDGMNSVIDYVNPQPDMMSGGPMSRNGYRHYPAGYSIPANSSLIVADGETEADMGSSPYQEQDTGPTDIGPRLMMSGGPMTRNSGRAALEKMLDERRIEEDKYLEDYRRYHNDPDRQREGMMSGAYKTFSNQSGRGLLSGNLIGEDMNRNGRINPVLKAEWDAEIAGTRGNPMDYQPWRAGDEPRNYRGEPQSDWAKWKASMKPQER